MKQKYVLAAACGAVYSIVVTMVSEVIWDDHRSWFQTGALFVGYVLIAAMLVRKAPIKR